MFLKRKTCRTQYRMAAVLGMIALCAGTVVNATLVDDLLPGQWYEVPNSRLVDVAPQGWSANVIKPWSGGAYDTKRDRLIVWGGGHKDYSGNEIYVFDVASLKWIRLTDPSSNTGGTEVGGLYPDGLPRSRHTYDYLEYVPNIDKFLVFGGFGLYPSGQVSESNTHSFNFDILSWDSTLADVPTGGTAGTAVYNPADGNVWYNGLGSGNQLVRYNPVTDRWTTHAKKSIKIYAVAAIDPTRNIMVAIGGYNNTRQMYKWDLSNPDAPPVDLLGVTSGASDLVDNAAPGFVYDEVSDKFVAWDGGGDVYLLNPDTWAWTRVSPTASNRVIPTAGAKSGTYGRFQYIPSKNAFIVVNSKNESVYFYKLTGASGGTSWPSVTLNASAASVASGASVELTWSAANADSCTASGDWSGARPITGTRVSAVLTTAARFTLTCTGNGRSAASTVMVDITGGDTTPPSISSVNAADNGLTATVQFDEPVSTDSAENIANYQFDQGLTVTAANLQNDTTRVVLTTMAMVGGSTYTLTVNGIIDRAPTPNTIAAGTQASFTFASMPDNSMTPSEYKWDVINDDIQVYIDRNYTYTDVPTPYIGMTYLRTANDHKNESGSGFVQFPLDADSRLYIGFDIRSTPIPDWLQNWTNTGDSLEATHTTLGLYYKDFGVGTVRLDGNALGNSMYVVLVGPEVTRRGSSSGGASGSGTSGGGAGDGGSSSGGSGSGGGTGDGTESESEEVAAGSTGPLVVVLMLLIYGLRLRRSPAECRFGSGCF